MWAAANGRSTLGIPKTVGEEFVGDAAVGPNGHAAGIVYVAPDGDVLLLRRSATEKNYGGHWGLPGGGGEDGESPEQTALREAREELGGTAPEGAMRALNRRQTPNGMVFHTFAAPVESKFTPTLDGEHSGYAWASLDMLPRPLHPSVAEDLGNHIGAADDMAPEEWQSLRDNFAKWTREEQAEPEHADDELTACDSFEESKHPRGENGEFSSGGNSSAGGVQKVAGKMHHSTSAGGGNWALGFQQKYSSGASAKEALSKVSDGSLKKGYEALKGFEDPLTNYVRSMVQAEAERRKIALDYLPPEIAEAIRQKLSSGATPQVAFDWAMKLAEVLPAHRSSGGIFAFDRGSVRDFDADGRMHVRTANVSKATVNPYLGSEIPDYEELGLNPNRIYKLLRHPEELAKAAATFNNLPLLDDHVAVNAQDHQPDRVVGSLGTHATYEHPFLKNNLVVWAKHAIDGIESDEQRELSSSYRYRADMTPGEYEGEHYDGVMRDIVGNHVALVKKGRAGSDVVVGDSQLQESNTMKTKLTRSGLFAMSAIAAATTPLLAKDAALDLSVITSKFVPGKSLKDQRDVIVAGLKTLKLAKDANLDGVIGLLDKLDAKSVDADLDPNSAPVVAAGEEEQDEAMDAGAGAKIGEYLRGCLGRALTEEDIAKVAEMANATATDADPAMQPGGSTQPPAADEDDDSKKEDMVDKKAMDAAIQTAVDKVRKDTIKLANDIAIARDEVEPWVGKIATVAFDSAEQVYGKALEMLNVPTKGIHPSAFKPILQAQPKAGAQKQHLANDAAMVGDAASFAADFPNVARIKTA